MHWLLIVPYANLHLHTPPSPAPSPLPPARPGVVSVWQALGPVRRPVGCDGQQLRVPLPAVWRPLGSRPGAQPAKVTSLQLRRREKKKEKKKLMEAGCGSRHFHFHELDIAANKWTNTDFFAIEIFRFWTHDNKWLLESLSALACLIILPISLIPILQICNLCFVLFPEVTNWVSQNCFLSFQTLQILWGHYQRWFIYIQSFSWCFLPKPFAKQ